MASTLSGYVFVYGKFGDIGFTVPNTGGTARVTGYSRARTTVRRRPPLRTQT